MSARPGRMREQIEVPLSRPRSFEVLTTKEFVDIKKHLLSLIHDFHPAPGVGDEQMQ